MGPDQSHISAAQQQRRTSIFRETGLFDDSDTFSPSSDPDHPQTTTPQRPVRRVRFRSNVSLVAHPADSGHESDEWEDVEDEADEITSRSEISKASNQTAHKMAHRTPTVWSPTMLSRLAMIALLIAISLPIVSSSPFSNRTPLGAKAGAVLPLEKRHSNLERRQEESETDICKRWSHQSAVVNGTLYMFGGRATTSESQTSDTWNNYFVSLDLTQSWGIQSPSLTGLPRPSGPPPVANGYLFNSHESLWLYGGQFSDNPATSPVPESIWEYNIRDGSWIERENPITSAGTFSAPEGEPVQRSSEGAGFNVASIGRGWYFGGHLDTFTTYEWDISIARVYIKSLIEFTMPGYSNSGVETLQDGQTAGEGGVWRNVTEGGAQDSNGFPERADGILQYMPGFGAEGILLGLTGGTNATFTQTNVIDVFDIATSTWYKQSTSGTTPRVRVNPCSVVAAAPDGSSYNLYMFGGQNLQPYQQQIQYDDMWILSLPSFTWIEVTQASQVPPGRSGHTCNVWDGQMIMVGGYVGEDLSCDSPGIYVFNLTSLEWAQSYTALTSPEAIVNSASDAFNPFSQQGNQRQNATSPGGLEGSYGYRVPDAVAAVIGGGPDGGATITAPVATPDASGPLATGKPVTYTITGPNGATITTTTNPANFNRGSGTNVGAIVAGVIAGVFAIVAAYFAFCAWVYRKQVLLYKAHVAAAQRSAADPARAEKDAFIPPQGPAAAFSGAQSKTSSERYTTAAGSTSGSSHVRGASSGTGTGGGGTQGAGAHIVTYGDRDGMERKSSVGEDSDDDLLSGSEPSFWGTRGVLLNPRRSLRVINRD